VRENIINWHIFEFDHEHVLTEGPNMA